MSSQWVKSNRGIDAPEPVPLTPEQIENVIANFPFPPSTDFLTSTQIRLELISSLRRQLEEIELVPIEEALEELKDQIYTHYRTSLIRSACNVGITTAGALGSVLMQMALDTFHKAGDISGVGSGLKGLENILYTIADRKDKRCIIHFRTPVTKFDILELIPLIVELQLVNLFKDKPQYMAYETMEEKQEVREWWHWTHELIRGELPNPSYIVRLSFDNAKLHKHRITLDNIAEFIEKNAGNVVAVISTMRECKIDLFIRESRMRGSDDISLEQLFRLQNKILPELLHLRIKGIPSIQSLHPVEVSVITLMKDNRRLRDWEIERKGMRKLIPEHSSLNQANSEDLQFWHVEINMSELRATGAPINSLIRMVQLAGIEILKYVCNGYGKWSTSEGLGSIDSNGDYSHIGHITEFYCAFESRDIKTSPTKKVSSWISTIMGNKYRDLEEELERKNAAGEVTEEWYNNDFIVRWQNLSAVIQEIELLATYTYAITDGSNLLEIFKLPWVDTSRSYCNDIHEMNRIFGCETARTYMAYELTQVLASSGISINSRHISLILDFMTIKGFPLGVRSSAAATRNSRNFLSNSTSDRTFGIYVNSSVYQMSEVIGSVPASLMVGELPRVGLNAFHHFPSIQDVERERKRIEQRKLLMSEGPSAVQNLEALNRAVNNAASATGLEVGVPVDVPMPQEGSVPVAMPIPSIAPEPITPEVTPKMLEILKSAPILSFDTVGVLIQLVQNWKPIPPTSSAGMVCQILPSTPEEVQQITSNRVLYNPPQPPQAPLFKGFSLSPHLEARLEQKILELPQISSDPGLAVLYQDVSAGIASLPTRRVRVPTPPVPVAQNVDIETIASNLENL